jgi:hypothetical protein
MPGKQKHGLRIYLHATTNIIYAIVSRSEWLSHPDSCHSSFCPEVAEVGSEVVDDIQYVETASKCVLKE